MLSGSISCSLVAAGAMLPVQFGVNAQLAQWVESPIRAAFVSFLVGTIALFFVIISAFVRKPVPSPSRASGTCRGGSGSAACWARSTSWASIVTAPKLGAVTLAAAIIFGQTVASVVVDQFGWVGFEKHHARRRAASSASYS